MSSLSKMFHVKSSSTTQSPRSVVDDNNSDKKGNAPSNISSSEQPHDVEADRKLNDSQDVLVPHANETTTTTILSSYYKVAPSTSELHQVVESAKSEIESEMAYKVAANKNTDTNLALLSLPSAKTPEPVLVARHSAAPSSVDEIDPLQCEQEDIQIHYDNDADGEPVATPLSGPDRRLAVVRPGAMRVSGIDGDFLSQQSFLYGQHHDGTEDGEFESGISDRDESDQSGLMAEVVDEDKLFQEMLTRRRHDVVEAEVVDRFDVAANDNDEEKGEKQRLVAANRRPVAVATILVATVVVIALVVTAVLVSRSNKQSRHQSPTNIGRPPPTLAPEPTATPVSLLDVFRSQLLNFSAASSQNLDERGTAQNQALNWLATEKFLNASASAETIINRYVLAVVYFADNGGNWESHGNFLTFKAICAWHDAVSGMGAFCSTKKASYVSEQLNNSVLTKLELANNNLLGTIPTELRQLSRLTYLDLHDNQLIDTIPTELGSLDYLTVLNLGTNKLSGKVPSVLGRLSSLTIFNLAANDCTGTIPSELGQLSNLTYLELSNNINQLNGTIPIELGQLSSLTFLGLHQGLLTGTIPTQLGRLSSLTALRLDANYLTGSVPTVLGRLSSLTSLVLAGNQFSGTIIPTELGQLSDLTSLDLGYNPNHPDGTIPTELGQLSKLTLLVLDLMALEGTIPTELGNLSSLSYLDLDGNKFVGEIPLELGRLSHLTYLRLDSNRLSGAIPSELGRLISLTHLDFDNNNLKGTIPTELGRLSNLNYVDLSENNLSGSLPTVFADLLDLEYLYLYTNNLTGNLTSVLCQNNRTWVALQADCKTGHVECSCCTLCV